MTERWRVMAGRALHLTAVVALAVAATASAREKDRPPQKITPQTLDALSRQYLDAGLPLPPPDAPPMLIQTGGNPSPGRTNEAAYVIGFKLPSDGEEGTSDQFLMGTQRGEPNQRDSRVPPMRPLDAAKGLPATVMLDPLWSDSSEVFPVNNWLALAVQCHLRGYDRLAEQIFARGITGDLLTGVKLTPVGDGNPRDSLAATAWNHWMNALRKEGSDRREILARLEKLSAGFPALDGPFQRDYLESLRLAMIPGKGAPDSAEALIDALVDHTGYGGNSRPDNDDPGCVRLQELGFAAVPALIAHLDDRRMTRSVTDRDQGARFCPQRVNEVVSDLIQDIAGTEEMPRIDSTRPEGQPVNREKVERWWAKASALGEETYMTNRVFPPSEVSLQIVTERYPQHLGELYKRMLKERPEVDCQSILTAISGCGQLAHEERQRLLHEGVASSDPNRSLEAISVLCDFDRADGEAALIEKLAHWPTDLTTPYSEPHPETIIINLVRSTDSGEVWQAYERALFRASTAFRMEMLKWLADGGGGGMPYDVRRLALLELFLDDEDMRVIGKEDQTEGGRFWQYPLTADTRRITVRNFVAGLLGTLLDVKPPPGRMHDERWWAKYRADTRAAIDRRARAAAEAPMEETQ